MPEASVATVKVSLDLRTPSAKYPTEVAVPLVPLSVIVATAAPSPSTVLLPAQTISTVGRIKLVNPSPDQLQRGADGLFRSTSGQPIDSDSSVHLVSGTLESSNVNIAETMANMIELARNYEVQVKAMKTAEDTAASSTKLLQSS